MSLHRSSTQILTLFIHSVCLTGNTALIDITKNVPSNVFLQEYGTRCKCHKSHFENFPTLPYFFGTGCWRNVTGRLPILFTAKLIWFGQRNNAAWNCKLFYSQQIRNKILPQAGITGKGLPWHQHGSPGKNKSRKVTRSTWIWFSNS